MGTKRLTTHAKWLRIDPNMGTWLGWCDMRLIGRGKIADHDVGSDKAFKWLRAWASEVEYAQWAAPSDLQACYPYAEPLDENIFRFNVSGIAALDVRFLFEQRIACILHLHRS